MPVLLIASPERIKAAPFEDLTSESFREALFNCLIAHEHTTQCAGDDLLDAVRRGQAQTPQLRDAARLLQLTGTFSLHVQVDAQPVPLLDYLGGVQTQPDGCPACGAPGAPSRAEPCVNCHGETSALYARSTFLERSGPMGSSRAFAAYMSGDDDLTGTLQDEVDRVRLQGRPVPDRLSDVQGYVQGAQDADARIRDVIDWLRQGP